MMKTENEKARLKTIEQQLNEMMKSFSLTINEEPVEEVDPALLATFVGIPMAVIDALFAIRDGEPWRDLNSPEFIARKMLQEMGIGE